MIELQIYGRADTKLVSHICQKIKTNLFHVNNENGWARTHFSSKNECFRPIFVCAYMRHMALLRQFSHFFLFSIKIGPLHSDPTTVKRKKKKKKKRKRAG